MELSVCSSWIGLSSATRQSSMRNVASSTAHKCSLLGSFIGVFINFLTSQGTFKSQFSTLKDAAFAIVASDDTYQLMF
jgi:hypothetical protein